MARLKAADENTVMTISEFRGLNENPDGDTGLKDGELSECRNFRITADRHLQFRPGQKTVVRLKAAWDALTNKPAGVETPVLGGSWTGMLQASRKVLASFGGVIWDIDLTGASSPVERGRCTQAPASFFGFGKKVYLLNGHEYMSWDGTDAASFAVVEGYIPTVKTGTTPAGIGQTYENVNRLTGKRKVKFSPDGTAKVFVLGETDIDEVVSVEGSSITYTVDKAKGTLTFASVPPAGTNSLAVTYRKGNGTRETVEHMRFAEFYNGMQDTRVFLYGDGTNRTVYSGVDTNISAPSAEYFPDLYEAAVGDANTPITSMIRHYARLLVFKTDSAWSVDYTTVNTAYGTSIPAFYVLPVNRHLGNTPPGQVRLIENNPLTVTDGNIYQWQASSYSGNITSDARNAQRAGDRVKDTLKALDPAEIKTFNDQRNTEYWLLSGGTALILNYSADAWYVYDGMDFVSMESVDGELYGFTADGRCRHISRQYRCDIDGDTPEDKHEITAYAETGSMDFRREWQLKYSPQVWIAVKPESGARVVVSVETNRRSDYPKKVVSAGLIGFDHIDFAHFSFGTNRKPQVRRVKMKVKKAAFYKLTFSLTSKSSTVTLLSASVKLRYAGQVK